MCESLTLRFYCLNWWSFCAASLQPSLCLLTSALQLQSRPSVQLEETPLRTDTTWQTQKRCSIIQQQEQIISELKKMVVPELGFLFPRCT